MRTCVVGACAPLVLFTLLGASSARATAIYDTHDLNDPGELVPNADDGTPGRPAGSRMGNTVIFGGTARALDTVMIQYGTYHLDGHPSPTQTITLSLYAPDGLGDPTGMNGNQPGTLIGAKSITTRQFDSPDFISNTMTFNFNGLVVPDSVVVIVSSSLLSTGGTVTGFIASSDFTPWVGSNPFGDRLWFGEGPGTFTSNNTWAQADGNDDPSISNNMAMLFDAHEVPEPAALSLLCGCGALLLRARRATWSP